MDLIKVVALFIHIVFPDGDTQTLTEIHKDNGQTRFTMEECVEAAPTYYEAFKKQNPNSKVIVGCQEMEIPAPQSLGPAT